MDSEQLELIRKHRCTKEIKRTYQGKNDTPAVNRMNCPKRRIEEGEVRDENVVRVH